MKRYILYAGYPQIMGHFGIDATEALKKAGAPLDTFAHQPPTMSAESYFAFMAAVGQLAPSATTAIQMSSVDGIEQFSPPIFASYCAQNGRVCIERLARYKKLIEPMEFLVSETSEGISVELTCENLDLQMPSFLVQCELVFLVNILRSATKEQIQAVSIEMREPASYPEFSDFMGTTPEASQRNAITFSATDLALPFISHNENMWSYFEPELTRRLSEIEVDDSYSARVRNVLVELLPGGASGIEDVAARLGISKRTLQRKLGEEDTTFQKQLNGTRELLAKHYLVTTAMSSDEIAYLLGYLELNSFIRAFSAWTGTSPSEYRRQQGK